MKLRTIVQSAVCIAAAAILTVMAGPHVQAALDYRELGHLLIQTSSEPSYNTDMEDDAEFAVYKVADAVKAPGQQMYTYQVINDMFDPVQEYLDGIELLDTETWEEAAIESASIVVKENIEPLDCIAPGENLELEKGLYLVLAKDLSPETENTDTTKFVIDTDYYQYYFRPELVSIPSYVGTLPEDTDGDGQQDVAGNGTWLHDLTIAMKPERVHRCGTLDIIKSVSGYDPSAPVTFLFSVQAVMDGEIVYDKVIPVTFQSAEEQHTLVDDVPLGSDVTVTEVYSGASYTAETGSVQAGTMTADEILSATFRNIYQGSTSRGGSVVNSFTYGADGHWNWEKK